VDAGRGLWWIAEADGQPVSTAGIFWDPLGKLARFQSVDTRPDARGNGFCTGLLNAMLLDLQQRLPRLETCVIMADVGSQAERIYRRLGFEPVGRQDALWGDRPTGI
jgi:predicted GNAT family acetyltransferase